MGRQYETRTDCPFFMPGNQQTLFYLRNNLEKSTWSCFVTNAAM